MALSKNDKLFAAYIGSWQKKSEENVIGWQKIWILTRITYDMSFLRRY